MCDQLSVRMIAGNESDSVAFGISSKMRKREKKLLFLIRPNLNLESGKACSGVLISCACKLLISMLATERKQSHLY